MEQSIIVVSTKGQLVIPAEMRVKLKIVAGTRVSLTLEDERLILQPVSEELVDSTKGMFGRGTSLSDDLEGWRRADKW